MTNKTVLSLHKLLLVVSIFLIGLTAGVDFALRTGSLYDLVALVGFAWAGCVAWNRVILKTTRRRTAEPKPPEPTYAASGLIEPLGPSGPNSSSP